MALPRTDSKRMACRRRSASMIRAASSVPGSTGRGTRTSLPWRSSRARWLRRSGCMLASGRTRDMRAPRAGAVASAGTGPVYCAMRFGIPRLPRVSSPERPAQRAPSARVSQGRAGPLRLARIPAGHQSPRQHARAGRALRLPRARRPDHLPVLPVSRPDGGGELPARRRGGGGAPGRPGQPVPRDGRRRAGRGGGRGDDGARPHQAPHQQHHRRHHRDDRDLHGEPPGDGPRPTPRSSTRHRCSTRWCRA